jgi:hypothetical protein
MKERKLDGRYKKNVDTGSMSNQKIEFPIKKRNMTNINEVRKLIAEKKWQTMDGRILPIKYMTINHIKNTINFLRGKSKYFDTELPDAEKEIYIKLFQDEIIKRP